MRILLVIAALGFFINASSIELPDQEVPNTLGMQTKDHSSKTEDIEQISNLGAKYIRKGFYWSRVEKVKGVYDFSWYDRLVNDAEANGLIVLGTLYGGNKLYEDDGLGGIQTEEGRQGFAAFGAALAERYKDRNVIWEIWNEPNVRTFWNKEGMHNSDEFADEYTALVKATAGAMVSADPECFVMAGSVSNFWEPSYYWTNACFERGIGESGIRGWSVHPYGVKTPEEYSVGYTRTREIFVNNNIPYDFPILNSERGFSLEKLDEGWSGGDEAKAEEYQAWHFVRQYMIDLLYDIRLSVWYEWDADKFGIIKGNEKRAAYHACTNMVDELAGYTFRERLYTTSPSDYLLLFENDSGNQKMVVWTAPPAGSAPDNFVAHNIEIPRHIKNKVEVRDIYGEETYFEIRSGKINIELTGSPKYITFSEPSNNAGLSAITWPDAPEIVLSAPEWKHDTIPGFQSETLNYTLVLPEGIEDVPSLFAIPQDENASASVHNAKTLNGPLKDRTTTIRVKAEDDMTTRDYTVEFKKDFPEPVIWSYEYLVKNDSLLIRGIPTGTRVDSFLANLLSDSSNYIYNVYSVADGSEKVDSEVLSEGDTLRIYSADKANVTEYILYVSASGLDDNAILTSNIYDIRFEETGATISDFPYGTSIQSVLDSLEVPETARLSVVNDKDEAVPLKILNYDTVYVPVLVNTDILFKVTAQDMQTVVNYRLIPDTAGNQFFVYSNRLKVDQYSRIIASIPDGMSVSTFLSHLWTSPDGIIKVVDEYGIERTREAVSSNYFVVVSGKNGNAKKKYKLQLLSEAAGIYAFVLSDVYTIDKEKMNIYGISDSVKVSDFREALYPALNANIEVLDAGNNIKGSGILLPGEDKLKVTSGNGDLEVMYELYHEPLNSVTFRIGDGISPVDRAEIVINEDTLVTDQNGILEMMLPSGEYEYYAYKEDMTASGIIIVADTSFIVDITIRKITYPLVFTVTDGSDSVSNAVIMIDGRYFMTDENGQTGVDLMSGEYYYTVSVSGYEDKSGYVTIEDSAKELSIHFEPVFIPEGSITDINIHPNPSNGKLIISMPEVNSAMKAEIYNIQGKLIYHKSFEYSVNNTIKILDVEQGIYLLKIHVNNSIINKKIIIK